MLVPLVIEDVGEVAFEGGEVGFELSQLVDRQVLVEALVEPQLRCRSCLIDAVVPPPVDSSIPALPDPPPHLHHTLHCIQTLIQDPSLLLEIDKLEPDILLVLLAGLAAV